MIQLVTKPNINIQLLVVFNNLSVFFLSDIAGHATVSLTEKFIPMCHGPQKLLASFDCPQLTQVHGFTNMVVKQH